MKKLENKINEAIELIESRCNSFTIDEIKIHKEWLEELLEIEIRPNNEKHENYVGA